MKNIQNNSFLLAGSIGGLSSVFIGATGPLIAPFFLNKKLLKDSKSLSKSKREILSKYVKKNSIWSIGKVSVKEIDKINILQASLLAMQRDIKKLKKKPYII